MPRKKGDGRGRLGGRAAGTPNKEKPLKTYLRSHSLDYYTPSIEEKGRLISKFDQDIAQLDPAARADLEIKLLKFHTPQMQSTNIDMTIDEANKTLTQRLMLLAQGKEIQNTNTEE